MFSAVCRRSPSNLDSQKAGWCLRIAIDTTQPIHRSLVRFRFNMVGKPIVAEPKMASGITVANWWEAVIRLRLPAVGSSG